MKYLHTQWIILCLLLATPLTALPDEQLGHQIPIDLTSLEQINEDFHQLPIANTTHIILTIDHQSTEGTKRHDIAQQLVKYLIQSNWLNAVVYADLDSYGADQSKAHPIEVSSREELNIPKESLHLLNEAQLAGIPTYGWEQLFIYGFGKAGSKLFSHHYPEPTSYSYGQRYQEIKKVIKSKGIDIINHAMPHSELRFMDSQICQDDSLVFFSQKPGTLIIQPKAMHGSRHAGITAHFNAKNTPNKAISLYISEHSHKHFFNQIEKELVIKTFSAFFSTFLKQDMLNTRIKSVYDKADLLTTEDFHEHIVKTWQDGIPYYRKQIIRSFDPLIHFDYWLHPSYQ